MTKKEYGLAREFLEKILTTQPNLFNGVHPRDINGKAIAEFAWGFMETYVRLEQEKTKD
ncbi:hypothetical protein LMG26841_05173 [Achromobacter dolens]|uniref:Uncharacterized protein n=1 Tax=Achromobacter dolens TaxID=1287738 RepID=A0A6S7ELL5_9BURK|nr:hypothetical protein LMG26841_05173 [Achromobacter dolens]